MTVFPAAFLDQLSDVFDTSTKEALLSSLNIPSLVSIRLNPFFNGETTEKAKTTPQNERGRFLKERPLFTADPAFHAGMYYPQEANSMWIGAVFSFLRESKFQTEDSLFVLDLCAAPGGKTTDISSRMMPNDLLVANEVISTRNSILFENVSKWGLGNTIITKADAHRFGEAGPLFDMVFCDAPCSGEGMFRKDNDAISEWSLDNVLLCTQRQQRIVFDVWNSLKPGGFLIYSTCTFNRSENEDNVRDFCNQTGAQLVPFEHPKKELLFELEPNQYRCLPHLTPGEGLFFCILQKPLDKVPAPAKKSSFKKKNNKKKGPSMVFNGYQSLIKGDETYILKGNHDEDIILGLPGLVHPGTPVGSVYSGKWKPHSAIALLKGVDFNIPTITLDNIACMQYLKREFIAKKPDKQGPVIVLWNGHRLGVANAVKNGLNNLLPMEWRVRGDFHAQSIVEHK